jgi:Ca2+-binding RTX toxin-like protein
MPVPHLPFSFGNLHTSLINWMAQDARALANANGLSGDGMFDYRNAIEHSYVSAALTERYGSTAAQIFGGIKELTSDDPRDSARDQWNNEVGRRIGEWASDHQIDGLDLGDLIIEALGNGDLITDLGDPRISSQPPAEPSWEHPYFWTPGAPHSLRDYFGIPDFGELGDWLGDLFKDFAKRLGETLRHPAQWIPDLFDFPFGKHDPLVFDLDGHGVNLTPLSSSDVQFDLDGDGFAERTGWVTAGDGLLVRDANANGLIDNGLELFGDADVDGFSALGAFDLNFDHIIDISDTVYLQLRVWQDANHDGYSQAGELTALADRGIVSISLDTIVGGYSLAGNSVLSSGNYLSADGTSREVVAVGLSTDQVNTEFLLPEDFVYNIDVFALPNLRGYGAVPDLWVAMTLDPVLRQMVIDLVADAASFTSLQQVVGQFEIRSTTGGGGVFDYDMQAFDHMLARWAGVDTADDERIQVENIAETFMNRAADHATNNPYFYRSFEAFSTQLGVRFFAQVPGLDVIRALMDLVQALEIAVPADGVSLSVAEADALVEPIQTWLSERPTLAPHLVPFTLIDYDIESDSIVGNVAAFIDVQLADYDFNPDHPWIDPNHPFGGYNGWFEERKYLLAAVDPTGTILDERHRAYTGNLELDILREPNEAVTGTSGSDTLDGFDAGNKADLLTGRGGDDLLRGGAGNDTYVFADGCGADTVIETSGTDEIAFQGALTSDLVRYAYANGNRQDLLISFEGRSESVTIIGYFAAGGRASVEAITFPDGPRASNDFIRNYVLSTLATAGDDTIAGYEIDETLAGLGGNDVIDGGKGNDVLSGNAGNDVLIGGLGNDALDGGAGNDVLHGGGGDDVYSFAAGGGQDVIGDSLGQANQGGIDVVMLGAGLAAADLVVTQSDSGRDLVLTFAGSTDQIVLDDVTVDGWHRIERVEFADGSYLTFDELFARATTPTPGNDSFYGTDMADNLTGGAGDDMLAGGLGNDTLTGGAGNDLLKGGGGDDTYVFGIGSGQDVISDANGLTDQGGYDTIQLGAGIALEDLIVTQADNGNDLVIAINGTSDRLTLDNASSSDYARIERILFADGTTRSYASLLALATAPTAGNDVFYGSTGNDNLTGGAGDDTLTARLGNDLLDGGLGNDLLKGGGGDDIYTFDLGFGQDVVSDANGLTDQGGYDTIQFGTGITAAGITVVQADNGNDLVIKLNGTTDQVTLDDTSSNGYARIERVRFADGTVLTHSQLLELATGATAGPDSFTGSSGNDRLYGGRGDDTLLGKLGSDRLEGGEDNDTLKGGGGDDNYVFDPGFGQDMVSDADGLTNQGGFDIVSFGVGIAAADISVTQSDSGKDLVLHVAGTSDTITLNDTSSNGYARIEEVHFADGTVLTQAQLMALATAPTAGDDVFYGSTEDDLLSGGAGNDSLTGIAGNDTLTGGAGNDLLKAGAGDDIYVFAAGFGQDVVSDSNGSLDQGGSDEIRFGAGITAADLIVTQADNGNDLVIAINGTADRIVLDDVSSNGYARIEQVRFADNSLLSYADLLALALTAKASADSYWGDGSANTIAAGDGGDILHGLAGDDSLSGDGGDDILYGDDGNDTLNGGTGNDTLYGGAGNDVLNGGDGDDLFLPDTGSDTVNGGTGLDTVDVSTLTGAIVVDLALGSSQANLGAAGTESWSDVENVIAGSGADTLSGNAAANRLQGKAGADSLYGRDGNDTLVGGTGDDILDGGAGDDLFEIGVGDGSDTISGGDGFDTIIAIAAGVAILLKPLSSIEAISAGGYASVTILGTSSANSFNFAGVTLTGIAKIDGLAGADTITGSAGADTIVGGTGDDSLDGGAGDDVFQYSASGDGYDSVTGGDGYDTLIATGSNAWIGLRAIASVEAISAGGFSNITVWGTTGADTLDFSGVTMSGIAKIDGDAGNDILTGSAGADTIVGGSGLDRLTGGAGADMLTGGTSADTFAFADGHSGTGVNADRITDFATGSDKIDLSAIDANAGLAGDQAFAFLGSAAFSGTAGELRWVKTGGETWLQLDTDGDGVANMEIVLSGQPTPLAGDFVL